MNQELPKKMSKVTGEPYKLIQMHKDKFQYPYLCLNIYYHFNFLFSYDICLFLLPDFQSLKEQ